MDGIQGAILSVKLRYLKAWTAARRRIAQHYERAWSALPGLRIPRESPGTVHTWHIYALRCEERDALRQHLASMGIQTAVHYPTPVHLQPAYRHLGHELGDFPETESLFRTEITMPLFPELADNEIQCVVDGVRAWTASNTS